MPTKERGYKKHGKNYQLTKTIYVKTNAQAIIDWGDGTTSTVPISSSKISLSHTYSTSGTYSVKISDDVLTYLDISNTKVTGMNFANANNLRDLFVYNNDISSLGINSLDKVVVDDNVTVTGSANKILKVGTVGSGSFTVNDDLSFKGPIDKFLSDEERQQLITKAELKAGSVLFFIADKKDYYKFIRGEGQEKFISFIERHKELFTNIEIERQDLKKVFEANINPKCHEENCSI